MPPKMYRTTTPDDGFRPLAPERYITARPGDQLNYYRLQTNNLEDQLKQWPWIIYIFTQIYRIFRSSNPYKSEGGFPNAQAPNFLGPALR
jgi:hypothetical protein